MTTRRLPVLAGPQLLGLIALGFVALGVWPWLAQEPPEPATPPAKAAPLPVFPVLPPLARFAAVVERPLFTPSRRPDKTAPTSATAAGDLATRYRLIGTVTEADVRHAWLIENGRRFEIAEGDRLAGARVGRIEADRVFLLSGGGETVLRLRPTPAEPAGASEPRH